MNYIIVVALILLSGLFSGLTLGLFSLNVTELDRKARLGNKYAITLNKIRQKSNLLLCSLLLGNVAVNSTLAIFLGTIASGVIAGVLATSLIVVFGEIVPQAVFSRHALKLGYYSSWLVRIILFLLYPIAAPLAWILDKALGDELNTIWSKREIREIIKEHQDSPDSGIDSDEERITIGALTFSDKKASAVMTPRSVVYSIDNDQKITTELLQIIKEQGCSRIPVFKENTDQAIGILYAKDLISLDDHDYGKSVDALCVREGLIKVDHQIRLDDLMNVFLEKKNHIALLYDEYGSFHGIVTLEDIIEEVLRIEIVDEKDKIENLQEYAKKIYSLKPVVVKQT